MFLADQVVQRLSERVPALEARVEGVASLVQLISANQLPQTTPAARVMASEIRGGAADAASGVFRQAVEETVSVYLVLRNLQGGGRNELDRLYPIRDAIIEALCGWAPEEAVGVFRLSRAHVLRIGEGTLVYQIDAVIMNQLRIFT